MLVIPASELRASGRNIAQRVVSWVNHPRQLAAAPNRRSSPRVELDQRPARLTTEHAHAA